MAREVQLQQQLLTLGDLASGVTHVSLHTAAPGETRDEVAAAVWNAPTTMVTPRLALPGGDVLVWSGPLVVTYPEWGGGLWAAAQLVDPVYRAAVARWVANGQG